MTLVQSKFALTERAKTGPPRVATAGFSLLLDSQSLQELLPGHTRLFLRVTTSKGTCSEASLNLAGFLELELTYDFSSKLGSPGIGGDATNNDGWIAGTNWDCPRLNGVFGIFTHSPTSFSVIKFDNR